MVTSEILEHPSAALDLADPSAFDLLGFAAGEGHPDFPVLSRTHNPSSCVPCVDFSPWLRERIRWGDVDGVAEYVWRVREANPGVGDSVEYFRRHYRALAAALLNAPLDRHLGEVSEEACLDLRVALVLLAIHEGFSGFIMTGEAADFVAAVMAPHRLTLSGAAELIERRNAFVVHMAGEMSYWSTWAPLTADAMRAPAPPPEPQALLEVLRSLPLGTRAHAVDALRHLSADARVPRTLASLSRYETRKRGLDVAESTRQILSTGIVVAATDLDAWLAGWTRRDLLGFLAQCGVRARNSWNKERLVDVAKSECGDRLRERMADSGAVELAPAHVEPARHLREYVDAVREMWRVWLGFGTGIDRALSEG